MDDATVVMGWAALGLAVSFVAMILPFRRGPHGVAINIAVAVVAALAGGAAGRALGLYDRLAAPLGFGSAVVAATAATLAMHAVVLRNRRHA